MFFGEESGTRKPDVKLHVPKSDKFLNYYGGEVQKNSNNFKHRFSLHELNDAPHLQWHADADLAFI